MNLPVRHTLADCLLSPWSLCCGILWLTVVCGPPSLIYSLFCLLLSDVALCFILVPQREYFYLPSFLAQPSPGLVMSRLGAWLDIGKEMVNSEH